MTKKRRPGRGRCGLLLYAPMAVQSCHALYTIFDARANGCPQRPDTLERQSAITVCSQL